MKIAVTGSSGYVGGILASELRARGHEVTHWSRLKTGDPWNRYDLSDDPSQLPWTDLEGLVHAAYDFSTRSWEETISRNVLPSIGLMEAAARAGVGRILLISSISAFSGTRSIYGRAKLMIEEKTLELGGAVIRPGLVWGDSPGGVMGALERAVKSLPIVPALSGSNGLGQYLVQSDDLAHFVAEFFDPAIPYKTGISEAACPDPVPLKEILKGLATKCGVRRIFLPIPWQWAMATLKMGEHLRISLPFRSDSLVGLVHRTPSLLEKDRAGMNRLFRGWPD